MDLSFLKHVSLFSLATLVVNGAPVLGAIACLVRPTDHGLALMRPLSFAGISASVASVLLGLANGLVALARTNASGGYADFNLAAPMLAEAMLLGFIGFACMTVAWLCVAVAIRRRV